MECKNLGRGRVSFTSYIHQSACLSWEGFIIVSEQFAGVLCVLCGVCKDLFAHSFNICILNTSCMPGTGYLAMTKAVSPCL